MFTKCAYTTWADVHVDLISEAVVSFGLAARTRGHYMRELRAFAKWMRKSGRAAASPLEDLPGVPKDSIRKDPRHARRWLDADERRKFYNAARNGPPVFGISGQDRERLYVTAATTGLRANELRGTTWGDFQTGPKRPTVTIRAMVAKNSELVTLPLNRDTAAILRAWRADRADEPETARVFRIPGELKVAAMMRTDLQAAGIAYIDDAGRYADFHSLRHTFGVTLARAGVPPKTLKELMRHSTITLTMDLYAAAGVSISDQSAAVDLATTPTEAESATDAA